MSLKAIDWVDYRRGNHHIAEEEKCTITPGNDGFDVDDTIASFLGLIVSQKALVVWFT